MTIKVPQFRSFVDEDDFENIRQVFGRNYIAEGPMGAEFCRQLVEITGAGYGVLASNGTLALYLALRALGVGPGDDVIVQDVSFIASANAIEMVGATPVFVDIPAFNDLTVDLSNIVLTERTRAIMVAHLFGSACSNIEEVSAYCREHDLFLIEDAAQALFITNGEKHCGTFGDVGTFSFYADKTITTGEGGFVCTDDDAVYERMRYLRNQGRLSSGTFIHPEIGYNFRMTDMQSALGLSQLGKIDRIVAAKEHIGRVYRERLGERVEWLKIREDFSYIPFRVIVFVDDAETVIERMAEKGIEPRSMFYPFHLQPCFQGMEFDRSVFPNSEECFKRGICLPTWIGMTDEQIGYTTDALLQAID